MAGKKKVPRPVSQNDTKSPGPNSRSEVFARHPKYGDVAIALSKACAAARLAEICADGHMYLQIPMKLSSDEERETRAWIGGFAFDALHEALSTAATAYRAECASATKAVA